MISGFAFIYFFAYFAVLVVLPVPDAPKANIIFNVLLNGLVSSAELISINLLRTRAKIAKLTNALVTDNNLSMRDEIRRERRVELAQEGHRYWDIIRWKIAEFELPKPVLGNFFFKAEFGTATTVNLTPDNFILVTAASFRKFNPAKDYLWPMPLNEISLNPNLKAKHSCYS